MSLFRHLLPLGEDIAIFFKKEIREAASQRLNEDKTKCANCSTEYLPNENYCYRCGERKIFTRTDNSFYQLLKEFINEVFHFENKLLLTFIWLFRPGMLSRAYFLGVRNKLLKPISVLALTFAAIYFFNTKVTLFHTSISEISTSFLRGGYSTSNIYHLNIDEYLQMKSEKINRPINDIVIEVEGTAYDLSQYLFWLIWPIWSYFFYWILNKYRFRYSYHLVVTATLYSAYLFFWLIVATIILRFTNIKTIQSLYTLIINLMFFIFTGFSIKTAYNLPLRLSFRYGLFISIIFFIIIILFRQNITIIPLLLLDK